MMAAATVGIAQRAIERRYFAASVLTRSVAGGVPALKMTIEPISRAPAGLPNHQRFGAGQTFIDISSFVGCEPQTKRAPIPHWAS
jgi:hypothetical protein